ncbi:cytochrome P450 [Chiua virens]|nr:cytochrome P450 [Chiua virens]
MAISATLYAIAFGCIVIIYMGGRCFRSSRSSLPLPPGPPGLPWVGNVIGINTKAPWLTYHQWAKTHGDLVHSRLFGKDIIIINSEKIAKELLENHSSNNSDRPYLITNELLQLNAAPRFLSFQHVKTCQLLRRLFVNPEQLDKHVFEYTASIILQAAYDYDPPSQDDGLFKLVTKVQEVAISVVRPDTAIVVATFPMLLNLPTWFPGMSFKLEMAIARKLARNYVETAFDYALERVRNHSSATSMVHDALLKMEDKGREPDEIWMAALKDTCATAFLAASETSHAVLMSFFLMMLVNPATQEKARTQIDLVVGNARLPTIEDRPLLPYIDAIYRETLRYCPVIPLSVPHAAVDEDVYNGFRIPKGAILLPNLWAMAHDETRYPNPDTFIPERWLNADGSLRPNSTDHFAFGFGRRMCVGRHFAESSVWTVMARVLAVFKILKPLDKTGSEVAVEPAFTSGLAIHPVPFPCRIVPRISQMDADMLERWISASTE